MVISSVARAPACRVSKEEDGKGAGILLKFLKFLFPLVALGSNTLAQAEAPPTPTPTPPELTALVEKLGQASTTEAEDAAIANSPAVEGKPLRDALVLSQYRLTMQGDYARAERLAHLVERLARAANDPADIARAQVRLSNVLQEYGEYPQALATLDAALSYLDQHPEGVSIVSAYAGKGIAYLYEGDFARALASLQRAYALAEERKFTDGMTSSLNSMGEVYREEGLPERALDFYRRSRETVKGDDAPPLAFIYNNMGQAYEAMGELEKAAEFIERARVVAEKVKMPPRVATSLAVLGKIKTTQKKFDDADQLFEQSLNLSRELHDIFSEGRALLGQAGLALAKEDAALALRHAAAAVAIFQKIARPDWLAASLTARGRAFAALQKEKEARIAFEHAIAAIEALRGNVAGTETEAEAFLESRLTPYRELIGLLAASGQTEEALVLSERASAQIILDSINRGGGSALSRVALTPKEAERARALDHGVADLNRALMKVVSDDKKRGAAEMELRQAQNARENFEVDLSLAHPELKRAQPEALKSLAPLQKIVAGGETAVLKLSLGETRSWLFVFRASTKLEAFPIQVSQAELKKLALRFHNRVADRSLLWKEDAHRLYDTLLRSSENAWREAKQLIIVPDGELWEVPFQALLDQKGRPLIERASISYAPSLSSLGKLEEAAPANSAQENLVAFANPASAEVESPKALPPLPEMEEQARQLEKLYATRHPKIFVGSEAREEIARRELPDASLLHFATHGVLNDRGPLYSYLLLSQKNLAAEEDGLLQAWEIMHLRLKTRLAVLCGCETARGRIGAGEGVIGFSWALFVAGCPSAIVSQWKVDAASSTPLMLALHKKMLAGEMKSDALREAALDLRQRPEYRHPFYWAPFVLVGDAR